MKFKFNVRKWSFTLTMAIPLHSVYAALASQRQHWVAVTKKTGGKKCLKYLLSGPFQKKFAVLG